MSGEAPQDVAVVRANPPESQTIATSDSRPVIQTHRGPGAIPGPSSSLTLVMSPNSRGTQPAESSSMASDTQLVLGNPPGLSPSQLVDHDPTAASSNQQLVPASTAIVQAVQSDLAAARIRWVECNFCRLPCQDPSRCCECQRVGHAPCMRLHILHGYTF